MTEPVGRVGTCCNRQWNSIHPLARCSACCSYDSMHGASHFPFARRSRRECRHLVDQGPHRAICHLGSSMCRQDTIHNPLQNTVWCSTQRRCTRLAACCCAVWQRRAFQLRRGRAPAGSSRPSPGRARARHGRRGRAYASDTRYRYRESRSSLCGWTDRWTKKLR